MKTLTRIAALATGTALTASLLALLPASAQEIDAGGIELWGNSTASHPQSGGPYQAFSNNNGTDTFAIGLDDKLVALPGVRASLAVPPAVAATTVRSFNVGHASAAWAVTADGAVHKWGGARGPIIPDNTWTASQLGAEAVEVEGGGTSASVRLANGRAVRIDAFGISPCVDAGQPLTGVASVTGGILLEDGRVVAANEVCEVTTTIPANPSDPVVEVSGHYAVTESGRILQTQVAGAPEATNVPTGFDGKAVQAVQGDNNHAALLTDQGEVIVWRPGDGGTPTANFQVPAALADRPVLDLQVLGGSRGFGALYAEVANHAAPEITGPARVGSELTATEGDWLGKPESYGYQWLADDAEITGADAATYTPTAADEGKALTVRVTATRGTQVVSATSNATAPVGEAGDPLAVSSKPTVAGTAQVGQTLTGTPAAFNYPEATVTNQWLADGVAISGQTGSALALTDAHAGKRISFRSTATLGGETVPSTSDETGPVAPRNPGRDEAACNAATAAASAAAAALTNAKNKVKKAKTKVKKTKAKVKKAKKAKNPAKAKKLNKKAKKLNKKAKTLNKKAKAAASASSAAAAAAAAACR